ncbi:MULTISPECIES: glycerol-3-phosphate dehydrogenase/oxidase [unclassified Undibacterium]|uniref:glycerol-3-phosphate dehydrogenase/oxidase n=1 Tax=unclassified Undibacterium TaxID=2630295 RepID=UPI002AC8DA19|nr:MULTISPECIES: glycerol-3-phosphate dehydrogenase/oxidase [unclassified Undibacterium]MEB0139298.1 glycerol-3-phosphate dehydrogenase/oxidase [Undibacterium sp. CCC2.1]MEB0172142.1 glycerol-3-phosphate dehydrogenase/oxidase [Undibacterium sp. CCC1.1]MEB0176067.1 glycerol-3-phosphate dehydrogenase/oxidase [Undibacterium sp. CCC3.4]MEB0215379.1 glycerol-3-phosphate dehydrogenase/oxidase [Undibacterium sp. 5I2]WPX43452.1 glycerol-3-phosphate dehydrogenase/oxidase [Undibacterium sp. CCC3.4]
MSAPRSAHVQAALDPVADWDVIVIGGGITGAGITLEAARRGLKVLLLEQRDFAWGTSSRSSKLVHGGLRYIQQGRFFLTRDSVRERQALMSGACGLVEPQSFAFADYRGRRPGRWLFSLGLAIYDAMAGQRARHYFRADEFLGLAPHILRAGLKGGLCYSDAKTDDARLVLRVLQQAQAYGATALNYVAVESIMYTAERAHGVVARDAQTGTLLTLQAKTVINATGAWADRLRAQQGAAARLRPLRGSHVILPSWRLPVAQAVSLMHPIDGRPVFIYPWEGATLVGTTDVDHTDDLQQEAAITAAELAYLMVALTFQFPALALTRADIIASYAGVRPVVGSGKADPSKETRDHAICLERGLLTVAGGKLTTFRLIALDALRQLAPLLPAWRPDWRNTALFDVSAECFAPPGLPASQTARLAGHYGALAAQVLAAAQTGELELIAGTLTLWVELRWAARCEAVCHLEDLLLRRTRIGLLLRGGGVAQLPRIRAICQPELGWDDARWEQEVAAYLLLWQTCHALPATE